MPAQTKDSSETMKKIVSLCKRRGFIFQSSELYGGLKSCYDYGPLGIELKRNIKEQWWKSMATWTSLPPEAKDILAQGVKDEMRDKNLMEMARWRDQKLIRLLKVIQD